MEWVAIKFAVIGLVAAMTAVLLKDKRPEMSMLISAAAGALIVVWALMSIGEIIDLLRGITERVGLSQEYLAIALKVTGISLAGHFAASVCIDAGEKSIAEKITFGVKVTLLCLALPLISSLLDFVLSAMP